MDKKEKLPTGKLVFRIVAVAVLVIAISFLIVGVCLFEKFGVPVFFIVGSILIPIGIFLIVASFAGLRSKTVSMVHQELIKSNIAGYNKLQEMFGDLNNEAKPHRTTCPNCGAKVKEDEKECSYCESRLD